MNARMRRIESDWEQIKKDFTGHSNIIVTPIGTEPPEKYHVTYFVNGIYLLPDGSVATLNRHEVEITLHAEYPRYKPVCRIFTPIWHPNFRDGQVCIGDIWGAGESLSDIIINIGDMIQYKSWNSFSPLSADAAKWAMEHKFMFPVGSINLNKPDYLAVKQAVDIDIIDEQPETEEAPHEESAAPPLPEPVLAAAPFTAVPAAEQNDFDITPEELAGIEYIPSAQRMQSLSHGGIIPKKKVNFKTILVKGIIWAFIGAVLGFGLSEALGKPTGTGAMLRAIGQEELGAYYDKLITMNENSAEADVTELYVLADQVALNEDEVTAALGTASGLSAGIFSAIVAVMLGLFLGIGEGVYYGSRGKAAKYALLGAGISAVLGFGSGYLAQTLYTSFLNVNSSAFSMALVRGVGWSVMGIGVGLSIGLIKPEVKRIVFCMLGGFIGAFIGGFLFDYIYNAVTTDPMDTGVLSRAIGIVITGLLIGLGIGLLEQAAKSAWLKVVRGEFEGKEYLVFSGTTSIGNNGRNTIVLFKDKLVGPHHCDIVLEGRRYVLIDRGTPMGTVVNGMRVDRHVLRRGDSIAIGNSVLVFNTK